MPRVHCVRESAIKRTPRVMQLEGMFDVPPTRMSKLEWTATLPLEERTWSVGLIVGPSGCGKTTLAREIFASDIVNGFEWPSDASLVDGFPASMGMREITGLLSAVGFSSPPSWLRPFAVLSNGEQFRVTMARAMAETPPQTGRAFALADRRGHQTARPERGGPLSGHPILIAQRLYCRRARSDSAVG